MPGTGQSNEYFIAPQRCTPNAVPARVEIRRFFARYLYRHCCGRTQFSFDCPDAPVGSTAGTSHWTYPFDWSMVQRNKGASVFYKGQIVVYPAQGPGEIEDLERREIGGCAAEFYVIRILSGNTRVLVPVGNAANVGLRAPCTPDEALAALAALRDPGGRAASWGQNWNRRYREYTERLKSPSLMEVCGVLKELFLLSGRKELSFGERRLQEQAMSLVATELACVLKKDIREIRSSIERLFADAATGEEKNDAPHLPCVATSARGCESA
jgi:CarD family transcriptional regulator